MIHLHKHYSFLLLLIVNFIFTKLVEIFGKLQKIPVRGTYKN